MNHPDVALVLLILCGFYPYHLPRLESNYLGINKRLYLLLRGGERSHQRSNL